MKALDKKNTGTDWALVASILFWIIVILGFVTLISVGQIRIPQAVMEITEASADRGNLILVHQSGDSVWLANTICIWIPDISNSNTTQHGGALVLAGKERKLGRVSKLEPGESAKLEKNIGMQAGNVARLLIKDLKSGQLIFNQIIRIKN